MIDIQILELHTAYKTNFSTSIHQRRLANVSFSELFIVSREFGVFLSVAVYQNLLVTLSGDLQSPLRCMNIFPTVTMI